MKRAAALLTNIQALLQDRLSVPVQIVPAARADHTGADATLRLALEGGSRELLVHARESLNRPSLDDLARASHGRIIASSVLSARLRGELQRRKLNYVDLAGSVFILEPGLYVILDADRKPPRQQPSAGRRLNPFSKKGSLPLRALLEAPSRSWGVRELATETGLSVGHASEILQVLVQRGYARDQRGRISLKDGPGALRDWSAAYDWRKNEIISYVVPFEPDEILPQLQRAMDTAGIPMALTLLAGAHLVAPHVHHGQTHFYVPPVDVPRAHEIVREKLYGEPVSTGGTLHLLDPYYRDGFAYGSRLVGTTRVVSPVQLLLDLVHYPLRGAEAARMVALGPLAEQLGLNRTELRELTEIVE